MTEEIKETLKQVTIDTLEKLAFIFAYGEEDAEEDDFENMTTAGVEFSGPFSGLLMMTISNSSLAEIAANMMGKDDDEEIPIEQQNDTLKEALNIICGNLLPKIADSQVVFNIGTPETFDNEKRCFICNSKGDFVTTGIELDEGSCIMHLRFDEKK